MVIRLVRILHLNLEKSWRGGERQTLFTLQGQRAVGHEVALVARTGSPLAQAARAENIKVYECGNSWALFWRLICLSKKFDVFHAQTAQSASALSILKPFFSGLTVFTRRTAFSNPKKYKRQAWKWSRIQVLVAISEAAAKLPKSMGLSVDIIPSAVSAMAVNPQAVQSLIEQYDISERTVLVTAAALSREKDPATLIRAVNELRNIFPEIICLHCGADGDAAIEARNLVKQLDLQEHYIFTGFQKNIADYMALAKVYISSSRFEALGTSVLDACLAGIPVVATDTGGHKEILSPDYGLLTAVGDYQAIVKKVTWLLQHQDVAKDMANRAQQMVLEQFSVPTMVGNYLKLYSSLRVLR